MVNQVFLSETEHNERLVEVLVESVLNDVIKESSALDIARDMWKSEGGVFCKKDKSILDNLWANCLMKKIIIRNENNKSNR
jgi:hypothetical protein